MQIALQIPLRSWRSSLRSGNESAVYGDEWDKDESSIVISELENDCPMDIQFIPCSDCSGVCILG